MPQLTIDQAFDLAVQHQQKGDLAAADNLYRQILAADPVHAGALHHLGMLAYHAGRHDIAVQLIRRAIALRPEDAQAYSNLGGALRAQGLLDEAVDAFQQTAALRPDDPGACIALGNSLIAGGRTDEAIAAYRRAIALRPGYFEAHNNLGNALMERRRLEEAIAAYRHALDLEPDHPQVYVNLGTALKDQGRLGDAIVAFRKAIALQPGLTEARINLGNALKDSAQPDDAIAVYRQAIALNPGSVAAHSNLLLSLHYLPDCDPQTILEEHRAWDRQHADPLSQYIKPHLNDRSFDRRLRIGYLSPDFRDHAVARFLLPLLSHHDKKEAEVFAYSNVRIADSTTERLRAHVDTWRRIAGLSDADAAELIRADQIDILVDLAGHTAGNRLTLMARKPAPVQVTYLGYPNTTGLSTVDYRLSDALADPPGETERFHSEKLVRLPDGMWCYSPDPPDPDAPPITAPPAGGVAAVRGAAGATPSKTCAMEGGGPPPPELLPFATSAAIGGVAGATPSKTCAMEGGGPPPPGLSPFATPAAISDEVVFGSLSQRAKINQNVLRLWATLLMRVPASRLLLKDMALDDRTGRRNALDVLGAQGVTEDRVRFLDRAPTSAQHLAQYRLMDIALDPFPYNGTTTTCEALWMGLPVVVLAGRTHVSRVGVSLLTRIGLSELIAQTPEQYVEIAAELANDVPRLAELRSSLRDRMCQSPLMDGRRFAASVEAAYRRMWRSWCENGPAGAPESGSKGA